MIATANLVKRLAASLKSDFGFLLYFGPPIYSGWLGTGVIVPLLWWVVLALLAVASEYRPDPYYDELKSRTVAFAIALVVFVSIYYVARWLSPY